MRWIDGAVAGYELPYMQNQYNFIWCMDNATRSEEIEVLLEDKCIYTTSIDHHFTKKI